MNPMSVSFTALGAAMIRSLHTRADPAPVLDDPWGDRLVPEAAFARVREAASAYFATVRPGQQVPPDIVDLALRQNPAFANVILRARYAEDVLEAAVARGVRQYVLVGAGFDSFACRRPAWAEGLAIYEVDHPATQRLKRERLAACGMALPGSVHFVEADLATEALGAALAHSAFRADAPTFFSWLGVTMYLTREANLETLRAMAGCTSATCELVISYIDQAVLEPAGPADDNINKLRADVSSVGEAILSGFDPVTLQELLRENGWGLVEDLDGLQALARYDAAGRNKLQPSASAHLAHARALRPERG